MVKCLIRGQKVMIVIVKWKLFERNNVGEGISWQLLSRVRKWKAL